MVKTLFQEYMDILIIMNIGIIMAGGIGTRMAKDSDSTLGLSKECFTSAGSLDDNSSVNQHPLPKQFMNLGEKPIIMHSLEAFLESGCFDAVYVGIHSDWMDYMQNLVNTGESLRQAGQDQLYLNQSGQDQLYLNQSVQDQLGQNLANSGRSSFNRVSLNITSPIHIVPGGEDRNSTLQNVLSQIESDLRDAETSENTHISEFPEDTQETDFGLDPIVVTHDGVRPFVTVSMIEDSIDAAHCYGACTVAIPSTDTIAFISEAITANQSTNADSIRAAITIKSIPNRAELYNIQTPQSFRLSYFKKAYASLSNDQISQLTDVCGVFTMAQYPVHIIPGDVNNIKITRPLDLAIAEAIVKSSI